MQKVNLEFLIGQATDERQTAPIAKAVADAVEVGVVVPSILRRNLDDAGLTVVEDETTLSEHGFASLQALKRTVVLDGELIVAMGAAGDLDEAILHAMLGWFREHPLPDADVPQGLATLEPV